MTWSTALRAVDTILWRNDRVRDLALQDIKSARAMCFVRMQLLFRSVEERIEECIVQAINISVDTLLDTEKRIE
jgi:hypothetical protein